MIVKYISDTLTYLDNFAKCRESQETVLLVGTTTKLTVYDTGKNDIDYVSVYDKEAIVIPVTSNGGSAITLPGDIGFYFSKQGYSEGWCRFVFSKIQEWLSSRGIIADYRNNDLSIFGKKFAGYTEHPNKKYSFGIIFVAMNNAQDYVRAICTKPKTKDTMGLRDFGIIADEIIDVVVKATEQYLDFMKGVK